MTNPVILLGTQSNGETLPVQVDATGRLVAEGLQGSKGDQGEQGPPGADGGSFLLPPDPYEGAILGWLNGELAWIGTPPVVIPEGVFGPITSWDRDAGYLEVAEAVPAYVQNGVYIWQCDDQGNNVTPGWNISEVWSAADRWSGSFQDEESKTTPFDGSQAGYMWSVNNSFLQWDSPVRFTGMVSIKFYQFKGSPTFEVNGTDYSSQINAGLAGTNARYVDLVDLNDEFLQIKTYRDDTGGQLVPMAIKVGGEVLVDSEKSLNMRVSSVPATNGIIGVRNVSANFEVGQYLRVPQQRVAPWVLYGNDPTSLIDPLRQTRD